MYEPKSLIHSNGSTVTMSSLEMVEYINSMRVDGDPPLTHANFLAKVDKVLGETSHSFECDLPDSYGRSRRGYRFPKREACLMAMSYSYDLQAKVFDKMSELEQAIKAPSTDQLPIEVASRTFNALHSVGVTIGLQSNVAAISANQATLRLTGNNMLELIGHTHLASEVQDLILTPTKLGAPYGLSGMAFNKLLAAQGFQTKFAGEWKPTDKAAGLYRFEDTGKAHGSGTPILQLKWYSRIVDVLGLKQAA